VNAKTKMLLGEFVELYEEGENPSILEFCRRAGNDGPELARRLESFLDVAPEVELTDAAKVRHVKKVSELFGSSSVAEPEVAAEYTEESVLGGRKAGRKKSVVRFLQGLIQVATVPALDSAFAVKGDNGDQTERLTVPLAPVGFLILKVRANSLLAELEVHGKEVDIGDRPTIYFPSVDRDEGSVLASDATWHGEEPGIAVFEKEEGVWKSDLGEIGELGIDLDALASGAGLYRVEQVTSQISGGSKLASWLREKTAGISGRLAEIEIGFVIAPLQLADVRSGGVRAEGRSPGEAVALDLDSSGWNDLLGPHASGSGQVQGDLLTLWIVGEIPPEGLTAAVETPDGSIVSAEGTSAGEGVVEFQLDWTWEAIPQNVGLINAS